MNAEDLPARDAALRRHVAAMRTHIQQLAAKGYQALDQGSVDYVLMFIPIEGAFSEALRVDGDLARFAMENGVGLATPTTLMLTLRTVDHIWTVERRESNAMQTPRGPASSMTSCTVSWGPSRMSAWRLIGRRKAMPRRWTG